MSKILVNEIGETGGNLYSSSGIPIYLNIKKFENEEEIFQTVNNIKNNFEYRMNRGWYGNVRTTATPYNEPGQSGEILKIATPLLSSLAEDITCYLRELNFDFHNYDWVIPEIWANKYYNNEQQENHDHVSLRKDSKPSLLSLVYYPEDNDSHIFIINDSFYQNLSQKWFIPETSITGWFESEAMVFKKNSIIIFPSFLEHNVCPILKDGKQETERFTISMNIFVDKKEI